MLLLEWDRLVSSDGIRQNTRPVQRDRLSRLQGVGLVGIEEKRDLRGLFAVDRGETTVAEEPGPRVHRDDLKVAEEGREDLLETRLSWHAAAQEGLDFEHAVGLCHREDLFHGWNGCIGLPFSCFLFVKLSLGEIQVNVGG
jgi:hypothetical protein